MLSGALAMSNMSMAYAAEADEVVETVAEESSAAEAEAEVEKSVSEESVNEVVEDVAEEVTIEDEAPALAAPGMEEEVVTEETTVESDSLEEVTEDELTELEEDAVELEDEVLEEKDCDHIDEDEDGICDECGEKVAAKKDKKEKKEGVIEATEIIYNEDGTVTVIVSEDETYTGTYTVLEDGNILVEVVLEEAIEVCQVNVAYSNEEETNFNIYTVETGTEVEDLSNYYDYEMTAQILDEANVGDVLETGYNISATVNEDGGIQIESVEETETIETEAEVVEEMEFALIDEDELEEELEDELLEEDEELTIKDEETPLAGDMDTEDEDEESEDEESDDEDTQLDDTIKAKISDVDEAIVVDEPSVNPDPEDEIDNAPADNSTDDAAPAAKESVETTSESSSDDTAESADAE